MNEFLVRIHEAYLPMRPDVLGTPVHSNKQHEFTRQLLDGLDYMVLDVIATLDQGPIDDDPEVYIWLDRQHTWTHGPAEFFFDLTLGRLGELEREERHRCWEAQKSLGASLCRFFEAHSELFVSRRPSFAVKCSLLDSVGGLYKSHRDQGHPKAPIIFDAVHSWQSHPMTLAEA